MLILVEWIRYKRVVVNAQLIMVIPLTKQWLTSCLVAFIFVAVLTVKCRCVALLFMDPDILLIHGAVALLLPGP